MPSWYPGIIQSLDVASLGEVERILEVLNSKKFSVTLALVLLHIETNEGKELVLRAEVDTCSSLHGSGGNRLFCERDQCHQLKVSLLAFVGSVEIKVCSCF